MDEQTKLIKLMISVMCLFFSDQGWKSKIKIPKRDTRIKTTVSCMNILFNTGILNIDFATNEIISYMFCVCAC